MSAGIDVRVFGESAVMINQDYKCIVMKRKIKLSSLPYVGTFSTLSKPWDEDGWSSDDIPKRVKFTTANIPQYKLALNDDEMLWGITTCANISKSITIQRPALKDVRFNIPSGTNLDNVYIYTFGSPIISGSNCGLQVFNANGEIVFDGSLKQLRMYRADFFVLGSNCPPWTTAILSAGSYWDVPDVTWWYELEEYSGTSKADRGKFQVETYMATPHLRNSGYYYKEPDDYFYCVADVTNY